MTEPRAMLSMWTVYDHPTDYPHCYVARRFDIDGTGVPLPTENIIIGPDLDVIREQLALELHLTCLARSADDDPKIIETWI